MENFRLKVFRTVADHLNFRQAAESLYLTQPAVTLQIKALEEELGLPLFDRTENRVAHAALNKCGELLFCFNPASAANASQACQEGGSFNSYSTPGVSASGGRRGRRSFRGSFHHDRAISSSQVDR